MADTTNQKGGKGKGGKGKSQTPAQDTEKTNQAKQETNAKPVESKPVQQIKHEPSKAQNAADGKKGGAKKDKKEQEPGKGTVKSVLSGDTIVVMNLSKNQRGPPPERTICLSNVKAPSMERRKGGEVLEKDQPWAWESREFLRKLCIGKTVSFIVDNKAPSGREYGVIFLSPKENLAKMIVSEGWAEVKSPKGYTWDELEELQHAEERAQKAGLGIWSKKEGTVRPSTPADPSKLYEKYKGKSLSGVVEFVINGSTLRLTLLPSMEEVVVTLSGVESPSMRPTALEPFGKEAKFFTEIHVLNREVQVVLEGADKQNLVATLIFNNRYVSEELLKEGLGKYVEWSGQRTGNFAERLRNAEKSAREKKIRLWANYEAPKGILQDEKKKLRPGKEIHGKVVEIANGGCIIVVDPKSVEHKVFLSSIVQSKFKPGEKKDRLVEELEKSIKYEAKEYLRRRLIGQRVRCVFDYDRPKRDAAEENNFYSVYLNKNNAGVELVENGLAVPLDHRGGDLRSRDYELMLFAEKRASSSGKGIHAKADRAPTVKFLDVRDAKAAKQLLPSLQRHTRLRGVVEYEFSASRFKLIVPKETCQIVLSLSGIQTPREKELAAEALFFIKEKVHQHDVDFEVVGVDKGSGFIGSIWVNKQNVATLLLEQGYAKIFRGADRDPEFLFAEEAAKKGRRGIWKDYDEEKEAEMRRKREQENEERAKARQELLNVQVTEILDGGRFFVQILDAHSEEGDKKGPSKYKQEMEQLDELMKQLGVDVGNDPHSPEKGEIVRAQFTEDDTWYRAKIISSEGEGKYKVLYIDYGNAEIVPASRIRKLKDEHKKLPPQAHEAELAYIKVRSLDQEYGPEAAETLKELVWDKTMIANVEGREGDKLFLDLGDRESQILVNAALLRAGFARVDRFRFRRNRSMIDQLREMENEARSGRYGIWEYGDPGSDDEDDERRQRRN